VSDDEIIPDSSKEYEFKS